MTRMPPLKIQDVQVVDLQGTDGFLFLESLLQPRGGWCANKSLKNQDKL